MNYFASKFQKKFMLQKKIFTAKRISELLTLDNM